MVLVQVCQLPFREVCRQWQQHSFTLDSLLPFAAQHVSEKLSDFRIQRRSGNAVDINMNKSSQRILCGTNLRKRAGEIRPALIFCDGDSLSSRLYVAEACVTDRRSVLRDNLDNAIESLHRLTGLQFVQAFLVF